MKHSDMSFIGLGLRYGDFRSDMPKEFVEIMLLQDIGFALGHDVVNRLQPGELFHNSYSAFIGQSRKSRKNTAQKYIGMDIVPRKYHLPQGGSPQAFMEELSEHNSGFQFAGEWSKELKGIKSGNYLAEFAEVKNDLFDCQMYRKRLTKGGKKKKKKDVEEETPRVFIIKEPYLCINTTLTPEVLKEVITMEMMEGGYVARHILVTGTLHPRPRGRLSPKVKEVKKLLKGMFNYLVKINKDNCCFELSDEALKYLNEVIEAEINADEFKRVGSIAESYANYAVIFADCLMVSEALDKTIECEEQPNNLFELVRLLEPNEKISGYKLNNVTNSTNPTNTLIHVNSFGENVIVTQKKYIEEAWRILRKCLKFAAEIAEYVDMDKSLARVSEYLKTYASEKPVAHSVALRATNLLAYQFEAARDTLRQSELIKFEKITVHRKNNTTAEKLAYLWIGEKS